MSKSASIALNFTGERFAPEVTGAIWYEHWHRYCVAQPLARGLSVLDAACGEGYGSFLLAQNAKEVVGIDIAPKAIAHARSRYVAPNLRYVEGSCTALPLADASVDLVVSFETIEHLQQQAEMLAEFRRVLAPGGVLVISSPNQPVYSDELQHRNEYHVRELTRDELAQMLTPIFPQQHWYGQRVVAHSALWSQQPARDRPGEESLLVLIDDEVREQTEPAPPMYFVVVCAAKDVALPLLPSLSLFDDGKQSLYRDYTRALLREKQLYWEELDARRIAEDRLSELITVTNDLASARQKTAALENRLAPLEDAFDTAQAELSAQREYTATLTWEERNARAVAEARLAELISAVNNLASEREKAVMLMGRVTSLEEACALARAELVGLEWEERDARKIAEERLSQLITTVKDLASERDRTSALSARIASLEAVEAELATVRGQLGRTLLELTVARADLAGSKADFVVAETELQRQEVILAEVRSRLRFRETLTGWLRWPLARLKSSIRPTG